MADHPFWTLLVIACVGWYATITIYVAVRGFVDIRHMLRRLHQESMLDQEAEDRHG